MRFHFATVPIHGSAAAEEESNQFLASHRTIAVDRQFVSDGARSAWGAGRTGSNREIRGGSWGDVASVEVAVADAPSNPRRLPISLREVTR